MNFCNSVRCQARRNLPGESLLMKVGWGREREQLFKICTTYIGGCWASPRQAEVPPSKPSVPPVRRSLVVDTPFSKHFLGFLRLISRKDRRPRVEDFMVVNSYLSAWCPGCVGPPPIFIQQGIKLWKAFRKLSDRKAYKIGFKQLQEKTFFVLSILTNLDSCTCVYQMLLRERLLLKNIFDSLKCLELFSVYLLQI